MPYQVFVSHSVPPEDLAVIYTVVREANRKGILVYLADRAPSLEKNISDKISSAIRQSDCILVFVTQGGHFLNWVQQEIGMAKNLSPVKPVMPVVENSNDATTLGLSQYIPLNRDNLWETVNNVMTFLKNQQLDKELRDALTWTLVGGVVLVILLAAASRKVK